MLKPLMIAGAVALISGSSAAGARTLLQYDGDGGRDAGPPVWSSPRDDDQPFTQTPTYYYNHPRGYRSDAPGYVYEERTYSYPATAAPYDGYGDQDRDRAPRAGGYGWDDRYAWSYGGGAAPYGGYTSSTYTAEQNARERRAFAANQRALAASAWEDGYGRDCYWSNRSGDARYPSWTRVCR